MLSLKIPPKCSEDLNDLQCNDCFWAHGAGLESVPPVKSAPVEFIHIELHTAPNRPRRCSRRECCMAAQGRSCKIL